MKLTGERNRILVPSILERGDQLCSGKYFLHSSFERVLNYRSAGGFVSMVTPEVGSGPDSIVCCELPRNAPQEIELDIGDPKLAGAAWLKWGDCQVPLSAVPLFDSALPRFSFEGCRESCKGTLSEFEERLRLFEYFLNKHAPERSLVFLLASRREAIFRKGFDAALLQRFRKGADLLRQARHLECFTELKGLGWGLTPSGDDFIAGVAMALTFRGNTVSLDRATLTEILGNGASSSLSTHLLRRSFQGLICARWKTMIQTLDTGEKAGIEPALLRVLEVGATSGADTATGWLLGLRGENWA